MRSNVKNALVIVAGTVFAALAAISCCVALVLLHVVVCWGIVYACLVLPWQVLTMSGTADEGLTWALIWSVIAGAFAFVVYLRIIGWVIKSAGR